MHNFLVEFKGLLQRKETAAIVFLLLTAVVFVTAYLLRRQVTFWPQAAGTAEMALSPSGGGSLATGQTVNVFVVLDAKSHRLSAVDLVLFYDSSKLEVQDVDLNANGIQIQPGNLFRTYLGNKAEPCGNVGGLRGKITLSGLAFDPNKLPAFPPHDPFPVDPNNPVGTFAVISFRAIAPGTAVVQFAFTPGATNDTNAIDLGAQEVLAKTTGTEFTISGGAIGFPPSCQTVTPSPSPPPVATSTPAPLATPVPTAVPSPTPTTPLTPTPTVLSCSEPNYDLDCDQIVCGRDASIFVANFGVSVPYQCAKERTDCNPDFNNDKIVNGADASVLMSNWNCR